MHLELRIALGSALEELRDALARGGRRSAVVVSILLAAMWLCVAGGVAAAARQPPVSETTVEYEPVLPEPEDHVVKGPIEWPTIAIAPRRDPFPKKHARNKTKRSK